MFYLLLILVYILYGPASQSLVVYRVSATTKENVDQKLRAAGQVRTLETKALKFKENSKSILKKIKYVDFAMARIDKN